MPLLADAMAEGPYQSVEKTRLVNYIHAAGPKLDLHVLVHAFMLHGLVPKALMPTVAASVAPHLWILSTFWQLYVLAPVIFVLLASRQLWKIALVAAAALVLQSSFVVQAFGNAAFFGGFIVYFVVGALSAALWELAGNSGLRPDFPGFGIVAATVTFLVSTNLALTIWVLVAASVFCAHAGTENLLDRVVVKTLQSAPGPVTRQVLLRAVSGPLPGAHTPDHPCK